jgi:ABC-type oligopeptide transport system substrate-binding subunit
MYEDDALDVLRLEGLPPAELDRARRRHADEYVSIPKLGTYYLAFIVSKPPFDDARVRRALVLATDREASAEAFGGGTEFPAMGGLIPQGMPGHSAEIAMPYDSEHARRLLAEAGYPDGSGFPTVRLLVWPESERLADHLQAQWREVLGIDIKWEAIEFEAYLNAIEAGSRHIFLTGWSADYPDPDNFLRVGLRFPDSGWRSKAYDVLVEEARRITDQRKRMKLYQEADSILMEDAAILPLAYSRLHFLVKPWAKLPVSSSDTKFWKDVIIEPH